MSVRLWLAAVLALPLASCVSVSKSDDPAQPITYTVPEFRSGRSVGNLRRLAVIPFDYVVRHGDAARARAFAKASTEDVADYLQREKGYEITLVADATGRWKADLLEDPAFGSMGELEAAWSASRTDPQREDAARRLGRALRMDGIVTGWIEYDSRTLPGDNGASEGMGVTWGILNIMLLNAPLFYELSHERVRIAVRETVSGRTVWSVSGGDISVPVGAQRLLGDLDNAIPPQLSR